ncbi:hypothetical protein SMICM304S_06851 [Streptomyces microflavus]
MCSWRRPGGSGAEPARCVVLEDAPPGAAAAHAAGMQCIAVPYVPATASDPAFEAAELLFAEGQSAFTAEAAYGWLLGRGRCGHRILNPPRSGTAAAAALARACSTERAPGMTLVTPGCWRIQRSAVWAAVAPWGPLEFGGGGDPGGVVDRGERLALVERLAVAVVRAVVVGAEDRVLGVLAGEQSGGERDPRDDANARCGPTAGRTWSRGLRRNGLRMICTLATPGRAMAVRASAQVSTLTA